MPDDQQATNIQNAPKLGSRENPADCLVIGAGPAGLTAAIYISRERKNVLVLEQAAPGGQIAQTHLVENYPGFPEGISGQELTDRLVAQAQRFGAHIESNVEVTGLRAEGKLRLVATSAGEFAALSAIIACGSDYKRIDAPGSDRLAGRGISYCATCDAPFFRNKKVVVVGGGNTAVEEAAFLTNFVSHLTIIHRSANFRAEQILIDELMQHKDKLDFRFESEIVEFIGEKKLSAVKVRNRQSGKDEEIEAAGAFVFIGRTPNTSFLKGVINMDAAGFITPPGGCCSLATNIEGVYAAGDCLSRSHAQLTTAASDGTVASFFIRDYLRH